MRCESTAAFTVMNDGSPVRADRTPTNSPGRAMYRRSWNTTVPALSIPVYQSVCLLVCLSVSPSVC